MIKISKLPTQKSLTFMQWPIYFVHFNHWCFSLSLSQNSSLFFSFKTPCKYKKKILITFIAIFPISYYFLVIRTVVACALLASVHRHIGNLSWHYKVEIAALTYFAQLHLIYIHTSANLCNVCSLSYALFPIPAQHIPIASKITQ